jgi:hypothetical protein
LEVPRWQCGGDRLLVRDDLRAENAVTSSIRHTRFEASPHLPHGAAPELLVHQAHRDLPALRIQFEQCQHLGLRGIVVALPKAEHACGQTVLDWALIMAISHSLLLLYDVKASNGKNIK